jgi:hypothetical protein
MMRELPDMMPLPPSRAVRLTLSPAEAVLVYQTLEKSVLAFATWLDNNKDAPRHTELTICCEAVGEVLDRLGDKLEFEPV